MYDSLHKEIVCTKIEYVLLARRLRSLNRVLFKARLCKTVKWEIEIILPFFSYLNFLGGPDLARGP